jgi:threonine dehydrogenase-like Zn-dependent dehydrogenase
MLALTFEPRPRTLLLGGVASRVRPEWALRAAGPLGLREVPEPVRPRPEWALLEPVSTGVCGSDVKEALLQASSDNPLSGLISFPHVPGHEILARVLDPPLGGGVEAGQLVAVDPWLGCRTRALDQLCPACEQGFPPHCSWVRAGGPWGSGYGMHLGNVRGLPGGFAPRMTAHASQLHPLPPAMPPELAVLADPMAVALHALDRVEAEPAVVLVLGAGTIGLCLALAARRRWPRAELLVTCAWEHQRKLVENLTAFPLPASASPALQKVAELTGAGLVRPWRGGLWALYGGADLVLDSIGAPGTVELALRAVRPRGEVVTVGVARPGRTETTLAYFKEVRQVGSNGYGRAAGGHQLDLALARLEEDRELVSGWLTHRFPLAKWREAFQAAARPDRSGAVKVVITQGAAARPQGG